MTLRALAADALFDTRAQDLQRISRINRNTLRFGRGFRVVVGNRRAQVAEMVIAPGDAEGGPGTPRRGADQWLFVVDADGSATHRPAEAAAAAKNDAADRARRAARGHAGETVPLRMLSIDVPPAYRSEGTPLRRPPLEPVFGAAGVAPRPPPVTVSASLQRTACRHPGRC